MINEGPIGVAPLNAEYSEPFVDWSVDIDPITTQTYYACEIDDGVLDAIRPPISSWQATVQTGRASYTQAVIPAATAWVAPITARAVASEFIIYRGVRYSDGTTQEAELARSPLGDVRFDVGPTNATMTISGYTTLPPPAQGLTRTLQNVRGDANSGGYRVRCDIDWFLRPGHTAISRGTSFVVSYINYYVNASDEYMDVGERAL